MDTVYRLWRGRKVKVFSTTTQYYMGVWEYEKAVYIGGYYNHQSGKRHRVYTPLFRQGKKKVHGYACWWIPVTVAEKIELTLDR